MIRKYIGVLLLKFLGGKMNLIYKVQPKDRKILNKVSQLITEVLDTFESIGNEDKKIQLVLYLQGDGSGDATHGLEGMLERIDEVLTSGRIPVNSPHLILEYYQSKVC
jgi:hypothetical protein